MQGKTTNKATNYAKEKCEQIGKNYYLDSHAANII